MPMMGEDKVSAGTDERKLSQMKNIGLVTEGRLIVVGVTTPQDLERVGPAEAYKRIRDRYPEASSLLCLYALQGVLWDLRGNALPKETKKELSAQVVRQAP